MKLHLLPTEKQSNLLLNGDVLKYTPNTLRSYGKDKAHYVVITDDEEDCEVGDPFVMDNKIYFYNGGAETHKKIVAADFPFQFITSTIPTIHRKHLEFIADYYTTHKKLPDVKEIVKIKPLKK